MCYSPRNFLAGSLKNVNFTLADVNCNSVVTTKDILLYHKLFAGHIQNFDEHYIGAEYKNYVIRDTIKVDGVYYFVASEKTKDMRYHNVVLKTTDFKVFTKVLFFDSDAFVRCFEYLDGTMYFSLGATKGEFSTNGTKLTSNPYPDRYRQLTLDANSTEVYIMNKACGRLLKVDFFKE